MEENHVFSPERIKYLSLLGEQFSSAQVLCTELIQLNAIQKLPKGTEHFMSDLHGEYEAFYHILNNCSGVIREKVQALLGDDMTGRDMAELCTLIYYPEEKLKRLHKEGIATNAWYKSTLQQMIDLSRLMATKYTRSKVRQAIPTDFSYLIDEVLHAQPQADENQQLYYEQIIDTLIAIKNGKAFICALASLIKRLAVDRLHVVGDIFDRGPRADSIMDLLMSHHSVDIEWGNHDVLWMGAASGSEACIASVVRNSLAYGNMQILENGYGISLRRLIVFAEKMHPQLEPELAALQAITVMMFKLEGQLIHRNPEYKMDDRLLLDKIDQAHSVIRVEGKNWPLYNLDIPTVSPENPYELTEWEEEVIQGLREDFTQSMRLRQHINFLYDRGRLYRRYNNNLLFHGCVPLDENGEFLTVTFGGRELAGKAWMDYADSMARKAYYSEDPEALDFMWYLWCGDNSPVCGRKIKTFARFFIEDQEAWHEPRNPYYIFSNEVKTCEKILAAFGLTDDESRIINGHTPIRVTHGESPLKAGGKLIVIDGGFCKAYQKTTGIAGYTLIANSHGLRMMSHQPFTTIEDALSANRDILSQSLTFVTYDQRRMVAATDQGSKLAERIEDLNDLLAAYRMGLVTLKKDK